MSRIGETPVLIPEGVEVSIANSVVLVKGSRGELSQTIATGIEMMVEDGKVIFKRKNNQKQIKSNHGLMRSLVKNMTIGVSDGFIKKLELVGTGYRAKKQSSKLVLNVGYSNPVEYDIRDDVKIELEGETLLIISGNDKQSVGQVAAEIRKVRPPEPYKGKGIRYQDEVIRKKAGKATKVGGA